MSFLADLHIHSKYSGATSPEMNLQNLYKWGQMKGIFLMGTGDFTHPAWFNEISEKLEEAESGLFRLKKDYAAEVYDEIPTPCKSHFRFLLTVEISSIYSKNGRVRKVHSLVAAPSIQVASKINKKLAEVGNIQADGRPILGLDAKELLKIVLDVSSECMFVPSHIWTPHFGLFGSESGFDSLEECFEELTPHITALETGLCSDPQMNWRCSNLDKFTLVSNSDAHSPDKLGREANRFEMPLSYPDLKNAIQTGDPHKFLETIEFYPEEGKYYFGGHAGCKVCLSPEETEKVKGVCPKCGKKITAGVMSRVNMLADRRDGEARKNKIPFRHIIPLKEIMSDVLGVGPSSNKIANEYLKMLSNLGNEFHILLDAPVSEIEKHSGPAVASAIRKMRDGKVQKIPGYDGKFGVIKVMTGDQLEENRAQMALF